MWWMDTHFLRATALSAASTALGYLARLLLRRWSYTYT